jgi:hypothetical protein
MALTSPGVEVSIIDQSQYLPAQIGSVPLVVFATAQNKANPNGTGIAIGTTSSNAGKLLQITSQRDLVTAYGTPLFYTTADGTPIQGYELNEYGLLAAYSALGVSNRVYCLRADIDLSSLIGQQGRPVGSPDDGAYWLDTTLTNWGIYEFNAATGQFVLQQPLVITDPDNMVSGLPQGFLGAVGTYAVNAIASYGKPTDLSAQQFFYKNASNLWVALGSNEWAFSVPSVVGTNSNPTLVAGQSFTVTITDEDDNPQTATITVPGLGFNNVTGVANEINNLGWSNLSAGVNSAQRLQIFTLRSVTIGEGVGTVLNDLGIQSGLHNGPSLFYGTAAQLPLWQTGQSPSNQRPSGSVWMKVGSAGNGLNPVISEYDTTIDAWISKNVTLATNDVQAISILDSTGGQAIPAGTIYGQYSQGVGSAYGSYKPGPVYLWKRIATGPTVVTGTNTSPNFSAGPYTARVYVTLPNSSAWSSAYSISLADNTFAEEFVEAWQLANIPYTTATVTTDGAIQITHTLGGSISISDLNPSTGVSNGLLAEAGFVANVTDGVKDGVVTSDIYDVSVASSTSVAGAGLQIQIITGLISKYLLGSITSGGTGYVIGDVVTFAGTDLGGTSANDCAAVVTSVGAGGVVTGLVLSVDEDNVPAYNSGIILSNWIKFDYISNEGAPTETPANNTNWYYSVVDEADIMVNTSAGWRGYRNVNFDSNGFPLPTGTNTTDPNGPIVSASEPTTQSDGTSLVYGDLWIDTSVEALENYPVISRWQEVDGENQWVLVDNTDQTGSSGIVFADARWSSNQNTINPANDPVPTIKSLLTSNNLDIDAPNSVLYPVGMLLFNTRRSGNNVKQYRSNYFNTLNFPDTSLPTIRSTWVSVSGLQTNGAPYMGRKAQRAMVVEALRAVLATNTAIRDEDNFFNLMATPNYPECQPNMIELNAARGETGYILGDTPMRLPENATAIQEWATNAAGAASTGEDGLVTRNTYMGLFYPSGLATDLNGNLVAVPPSHMMLSTFIRNDSIAYPWFAAAGVRRGNIVNASSIGYIDSTTGEFISTRTRIGIRDALYENFINPLVSFTGTGLLNYGNKTSFNSQSALDRTNVARLVAYIRRQLTLAARPYVFEPNDSITRQEISGTVTSLMLDLVAKRGIYDYLVVCDESNNTPARIDRNELWIDVAVEPVKAAEFIYIPVRILNTGELGGQG